MSVIRLTHLTDPHLYGGESELLRGIATLPSLEATLAHARQRDWPPDALLITGDLVQDDPAGYVHFRRLFGNLRLPVLCLPGNHDEPEAMRRELDCAPFVVGGVVDLGLWRIVLLDSTIPRSAAGRLGPACARLPASSPGADGQPLARPRRLAERRGVSRRHRSASQRARHRVGPRASELRRAAQGRAPACDTLHLRAVPAPL
jgi:3',5'-cyclic AMP phosphodiesterase CpdA